MEKITEQNKIKILVSPSVYLFIYFLNLIQDRNSRLTTPWQSNLAMQVEIRKVLKKNKNKNFA